MNMRGEALGKKRGRHGCAPINRAARLTGAIRQNELDQELTDWPGAVDTRSVVRVGWQQETSAGEAPLIAPVERRSLCKPSCGKSPDVARESRKLNKSNDAPSHEYSCTTP